MSNMALVDDIETLGRAVAAGEMPQEAAVAALIEAHAQAGFRLTEAGAVDLLATYETVRSTYEAAHSVAFHGLAAIRNGRKPHPSAQPRTRG